MSRALLQQALDWIAAQGEIVFLHGGMPAVEKMNALHAALRTALDAHEPSKAFAICLLSAASKSGDPGAISLAAQLADVAPCVDCNYVKTHCRCAPKGAAS